MLPRGQAGVLALALLVTGCVEGGSLRFRAILPAADPDGRRPWLEGVGCFQISDFLVGQQEPVQEARADDPDRVSLGAVEPGAHYFRIQGLDRSCDGALPNPVVAEGETPVVEIRRGESVDVPYFFAPVEQFSTLDVPQWVKDWFTSRFAVSVGSIEDSSGETIVLYSGGEVVTDDGVVPSAETVLFFPRDFSFERGPSLVCSRSHHVTVPARKMAETGDATEPILALVGGRGICASGAPAAGSMEGFDPERRAIVSVPIRTAMEPVERPAAVPFGEGGILLVGASRLQLYVPRNGDQEGGWTTVEEASDLPVLGAALAASEAPDGESRYLLAGGRTGSVLTEGPVLFDGDLQRCPVWIGEGETFDGVNPVAFFLNETEVLVGGGEDLGAMKSDAFRIYSHGSACELRARPVEGFFEQARTRTNPVELEDGRILLVGGDERRTAEVYVPQTRGSIDLGALPTNRDSPLATLVPGGYVIVAGGAGEAIDVFNPAREVAIETGVIGWDPYAVSEIELDVLVVVSTSPLEDVETGEDRFTKVQDLLARGFGGTLAGVIAALRDLWPPGRGDVDRVVIDAHVGVVTGNLGCPGYEGDHALLQGEWLDGSPPYVRDVTTEESEDVFERYVTVGEGDCEVAQLGRAAVEALRSAENGDFFRREQHLEVPLFVVLASPVDDCSIPVAQQEDFFDDDLPLEDKCGDRDSGYWLTPERIVDELVALKGGRPELLSIITMGGDPVSSGWNPEIGLLDPATRLSQIVEEARDAGAQGFHVVLDQDARYAGLTIRGREIEPLRDLFLNRLGRSVCIPPLSSGEDARCVLTYDDVVDGVSTIKRVPEGSRADRDGWLAVPSASDRCRPTSDTDHSPSFELALEATFQYPVETRVRYACE